MDVQSKHLYLITPLTIDELKPVNCLMMGAITIPSCVLLSAQELGHVPYVSIGPKEVGTRQPVKRFTLLRGKQKSSTKTKKSNVS